jgi:tetratricopeptide (TPR) repeat protein
MNSRLITQICLIGFFILAVLWVAGNWGSEAWEANPIMPLISVIVLAICGGIFFVMVILPKLGDAVGTAMYSSGEEVKADGSMRAAARMAAGDYDGAIDEYKKVIAEKPGDPFPVSEIAKIYAEKFKDPNRALTYLQAHLESHEWAEDNAAFLMFRIVDIHMHEHHLEEAKDILEQVVGNFPGTRHAANAKHKINEVEQLQFKELQAQRAKQSSQGQA